MTAWEDYLAATQRLDVVRRDAASVVAEQVAAVTAARTDLSGVRKRVASHRARLVAVAASVRVPAPEAAPRPDDLAAARRDLSAPATPEAVRATLPTTNGLLATAAAILSTVEGKGTVQALRISTWPVPLRNALAYLGFALLSVGVPLVTLHAVTSRLLLVPTIGCAAVFPLIGYALAWLTTGMMYPPQHTGKVRRTPLLGAAVTVATVVLSYTLYLVLRLIHPSI